MSMRQQRGIVMVISMLLLVILTLIGLGLFHSNFSQQHIAGNNREKQRALQAAEGAQEFAEWWLSNGSGGTLPASITCSAVVNANAGLGQICKNALPTPADPTTWPGAVTYLANGMVVNAATPGPTTYYQTPQFYITDLGLNGTSEIYQIDAVGWGATANAVAEVESTYAVSPGVRNLSTP